MPETDKTIADHDPIREPSHYKAPADPEGRYEVKQILTAWRCDFFTGSVIKYVLRAGRKDGESQLKDLEKARENITIKIEAIKAGQA